MEKLFLCLVVVSQVLIVTNSSDLCLKSYKRKLCYKVSIPKYNSCLFKQFTVFEENNKFCVTNTKCVSKSVDCLGVTFKTLLFK